MVSSGNLYGWMKSRLRLNAFSVVSLFLFLAMFAGSLSASAQTVATPTLSLAAGTYNTPQTLTLSDTTSGSSIYYSTIGTPVIGNYGTNLYTGPINLLTYLNGYVPATVYVMAVATGYTQSATASAAYDFVVGTPVFTPTAGTYNTAQTVTISDVTPGVGAYPAEGNLWYTTDGSTPNAGSAIYSGPITVSATTTLKAISEYVADYNNSAVASGIYTIQVATPSFSPAAGTYTTSQTVTISDSTSGSSIYYTTNGSTPTTASTHYTSAITVSPTETLQALATATGIANSTVGTAVYTLQVATPSFSPAAGTYTTAQTVTISDSTSGSSIYYTTNGSTPTTASTHYTSAISVSATETLKALATHSGDANSAVGSAAYTINLPQAATPTFVANGGLGIYGPFPMVMSDATSGATIYYTVSSTGYVTPTTSSTVYSGTFTINPTPGDTFGLQYVAAIATAPGYSQSAVQEVYYQIDVPLPTMSPAAGTYTSAQSVTIGDSLSGATIYYTTDGTSPSTSSTTYTTAVPVSTNETLQAIAADPSAGYSQSYTASSAYTINLSTSGLWGWMNGSSTTLTGCADSPDCGQAGVYGTEGAFATGNTPGGRDSAASWTDSSGNIWLFGGEGIDANGDTDGFVNLNDLWEFNPSTKEWAWIAGSSTVSGGGIAGVYGTEGTFATGNLPGSRSWPATTRPDSSGYIWLFGGEGYGASGGQADLNDLWKFNPSTKEWAWASGSTTGNQLGVYGTKGTPASGNVPGARDSGSAWVDSSGNVWVFGGEGYGSSGYWTVLNDLWKYSPSSGEWTWMGGSSAGEVAGTYGTLGTPASGNIPGSRTNPTVWTDSNGNFWLFGGWGYDSTGAVGWLNDLWKYTLSSNEWTWMAGSNTVGSSSGRAGVYGTLGTPASGNIPGGRQSATGWTDSSGNFWLTGGWGFSSADVQGYMNDVWEYQPAITEWAWVGGSSTLPSCTSGPPNCGQSGVYGTKGTPASGNIPGGRTNASSMSDGSGNLWLFGGQGFDASGNFGELNDMMEYQMGAVTVATPTFSPAAGTYSSAQTVTITDATSGATIYYTTNGSTPTTASATYSSPISVTATETLEALATHSGDSNSAVASAAYTISLPVVSTPVFSPAAGTYSSSQSVTITDATSGAAIYYTTNGSTPTTASSVYSSAISVTATETLKALATHSGDSNSAVASAAYTIGLPVVSTPVFSPAAGTYSSSQSVTITDATSGAAIYYTTNGSTPTTASSVYSSAISVTATETLKALATHSGDTNSAVASAAYTIGSGSSTTETIFTSQTPVTLDAENTGTPGEQGTYFTSDIAGQINAIRFWKDSNETGSHTGNIWSSTGTLLASVAFTGETSSGWQQQNLTTPYAIAANTIYVVSVNTNAAHVYTQYGIESSVTNQDLSTVANSTVNGSGYSGTVGGFPSDWWYGANYFRDVVFQPTGGTPVATPSFSPAQGAYTSTQTVTISDATPGASIYYTTNGTTPTTASTRYTAPISVSSTEWEVVQAVAIASGYRESLLGSAGYTVGASDAETLITSQTPAQSGLLQTNYPYELGTVFTSDIAGEIRAIRFWKDIEDVGTVDTGNIWNESGTLITSVVFNNETASGWQEQSLPTPLSITAGTQYVVSVNAGNWYDQTPGGFSGTLVNQDLSSVSGNDGVYSNNPGSFPGYETGINYFRDVVFTPGSGSLPIAGTPVLSPTGGTYTSVQTVTITDATSGATIYYTTTGVGPSTFSPVYTGPITVAANETLEAIAASSTYQQSGVASQSYVINLPVASTPGFSPAAGTYSSTQTVTITDATSGATIYYTTNGTQPSVYSTKYTSPISINATLTLNAMAVATGYNQSATDSAIYNIGSTKAATPTLTTGGTFTSQQTVTISDGTSGATIFYTIDGSTPTYPVTGTTLHYYAPFPVDATETVSAIATAPGYLDSNVGSATYTINNAAGTCQGIDLGVSYGSNNASLNGFVPFPTTNAFNTNIASAPIDPNSATILADDAVVDALHPSFGGALNGGYDYMVVDTTQTSGVPLEEYGYTAYSDNVVTPIPANYPGGNFDPDCNGWPSSYIGDQIDLVIDRAQCWLYELYNAHRCNGVYYVENEAIWDLLNYNNRPWGWTSVSASGLAKFPLEVRYDEVAAGVIKHALPFETPNTLGDSNGGYWVQPATHAASYNSTANLVTIGSRLRLKASFNISGFSAANQVILTALKTYGMIDVDNTGAGGQWFLDGVSSPNFSDSDLSNLKTIGSSNFDIVQATPEFPGLDSSSAYTSANPQYTGVQPVINSFTASSTNVSPGSAVTFSYSVSNDSYDFIDMIGPVRLTSGSGSVTIHPTATQTYTLYSTSNEGQVVSTPITVAVTGSVVTPPVFEPPAGTYTDELTLTLSTPSSPTADIYFTTDGTTPTYPMTGTTQQFAPIANGGGNPIDISASPTTVSAIAVVPGFAEPSTVSTATYYVGSGTTANTPTFTPPAGTYTTAQSIVVSAYTADNDGTGTTVYYTTDGTDPATSSTAVQYLVPIPVSATQTIRAIAEEPGYANSTESSAAYTIN